MVAYNLMLAIFPFALVLLFVAGRVLRDPDVQASVLRDLRRVFPHAGEGSLRGTLDRIRHNSTSLGIVAIVAGIWIGTSFWGAVDTAFCRIYHCPCRSWLAQKRFGLGMLIFVALFMTATVVQPAVEALFLSGAENLPLGISDVPGLVRAITLFLGLIVVFAVLCVVYWVTPKARIPWLAVWPGALAATLAIGVVNFVFPFYLSNVSTLERLGPSVGFVLVAMLWFYALALIILGGAAVNAMRYEKHDTGEIAAESRTVNLI
jgi:YihY family inner membrane protein